LSKLYKHCLCHISGQCVGGYNEGNPNAAIRWLEGDHNESGISKAAIFISFFVLDDLLLFKDKHFYAI
jgi:hypothetical protein